MLKPGDPAPDFTLLADNGKEISLHDFRGKKVVLYFYPKDDTPGCTKEACSFRENLTPILNKKAVVLGISKDGNLSHQNFKTKFSLNFPLLSDLDGKVCAAYGSWGEKKLYGKTFLGIKRMTFIIDETGKIKHIFAKVKPENHAQEVLAKLE